MSYFFDKLTKRTSATARIPESISEDLEALRDYIRAQTGLKVSKNDLITIGAILVAQVSNKELAGIDKVRSMDDLLKIIGENATKP